MKMRTWSQRNQPTIRLCPRTSITGWNEDFSTFNNDFTGQDALLFTWVRPEMIVCLQVVEQNSGWDEDSIQGGNPRHKQPARFHFTRMMFWCQQQWTHDILKIKTFISKNSFQYSNNLTKTEDFFKKVFIPRITNCNYLSQENTNNLKYLYYFIFLKWPTPIL